MKPVKVAAAKGPLKGVAAPAGVCMSLGLRREGGRGQGFREGGSGGAQEGIEHERSKDR